MAAIEGATGSFSITDSANQFTPDSSAVDAAFEKASADPTDTVALLEMQQALAEFNVALQVKSAVIKSVEDPAKSITQRL